MRNIAVRNVMTMLDLIFPGINNSSSKFNLPIWPNPNLPWSIISPNENKSIINQILEFKDSPENKFKNMERVFFDTTNGPIHIDSTAKIGEYVKIEGPCYIGKNAQIRHGAFLRRGSWICENAIVGHCSEIKNSILLPGSKAPHFNYVGDSILGFDVNIGAGAKLSNVRNDGRSILVNLKNGKKIDTELRKFGSLIGDGSEIGCNVVSNPGTILEPKTMINPNSTLKGWVKN
jgi:UDP-N-acetylglucosamine diphosphorylase / glucose-1-phosphate thymidylyltransferase / UDP-N-acetylgalactosamine diphosphorylase / glucosamine-1-phosphate N-acetyltransferase / galactosamine-1-phosphate N-acetyltransferase